jgi:hypothetical protein
MIRSFAKKLKSMDFTWSPPLAEEPLTLWRQRNILVHPQVDTPPGLYDYFL